MKRWRRSGDCRGQYSDSGFTQRDRLLNVRRRRLPAQAFGKLEAHQILVASASALPNDANAIDLQLIASESDHQRHNRLRQLKRNSILGNIQDTASRQFQTTVRI